MGSYETREFRLTAIGPFAESQVCVEWRDEPRPTNSEIEALIAGAWDRRVEQSRRTGTLCFPGLLCRLIESRVDDRGLHLVLGPTDYRDMVGTCESHPEIAERFGEDHLAAALAACAVLVSSDGDIVLGRRSPRVAAGGLLHVCAGHVEPKGHEGETGLPSPFRTVRAEAEEELGIVPSQMHGLVCNGLARILPGLKAELSFTAALDLGTGALTRGFRHGAEDNEHCEAVVVPNRPEDLLDFLSGRQHEITSAGQSSLTLHGAVAFGQDWLERAVAALGKWQPPSPPGRGLG